MKSGIRSYFRDVIDTYNTSGTERRLRSQSSGAGYHAFFKGKAAINLTSNNYLGLARHPEVVRASQNALARWGTGSGGSRLLSGSYTYMSEFERELAEWHKAPGGLLFNSGYSANTGVIPALAKGFQHIYSDRANHASIIDGIILSRKPFTRYRHGDLSHLEDLLKKKPKASRSLVITESLFSMDGDFAEIEALMELQNKFGFFLYIDEAHSVGGYPDYLSRLMRDGYNDRLVMGTFGKALAGFGAFIVGETEIIEYLINTCRTFIFSTALPPSVVMAAQKSVEILRANRTRQTRLDDRARWLRNKLREEGVDIGASQTHIIPVISGSNASALDLSSHLFHSGFYAAAIRPPTVPKNTARVRLSINSDLDMPALSGLAEAIIQSMKKHG